MSFKKCSGYSVKKSLSPIPTNPLSRQRNLNLQSNRSTHLRGIHPPEQGIPALANVIKRFWTHKRLQALLLEESGFLSFSIYQMIYWHFSKWQFVDCWFWLSISIWWEWFVRITVGEEGLGEVDKWTLIVDCPYTKSQQTHFHFHLLKVILSLSQK